MKNMLVVCLLFAMSAVPLLAQKKVAEGEYADTKTAARETVVSKSRTHWILYSSPGGGYHLKSEISSSPDQPRFVQSEDLDEKMVPTAVAYSANSKDGTKSGTIWCNFADETITCGARPVQEGENVQSKPFRHHGPFWLWVSNWFALDLDWLMAGAIDMAQLESGKSAIATVTLDGGGDVEWVFDDDEKEALEFLGVEKIELERKEISAKHYKLGSGDQPMNVWMAGGMLIKLTQPSSCEGCGDILVHYKQYQKLIPELPVEPAPKSTGPTQ